MQFARTTSNQRLFCQSAHGEVRDWPDVFTQKFSAFFAQITGRFEVGDANELSVFPNGRGPVVWTDAAWVGPGMDRNQFRGYGSGHMHRAAVDADDKGSRAQ